MDLPSLLQIVPSLPPAVSGVGDYAVCLARDLQARYGVRSRFLVCDPDWTPPLGGTEFPTDAIAARRSADLRDLLPVFDSDPTAILLHYVPYGYAPRGCPSWLVDTLAVAPRTGPLITVFHELSADNEPPWKSAFWLAPFQRRLGQKLGRVSDVRRMTTTGVANQMRAMLRPGDNAVEAVPVFSNLGEGDPPLPSGERIRRMVVFGTRTWRQETYRDHLQDLLTACRRLEIKEILDVGAPLESLPAGLEIPLRAHGLLRVEDTPEVFGRSLAGFFTYPAAWLGKSGIFAAYCAWGLVPVTTPGNKPENLDGLLASVHYLPGGNGTSPGDAARAAHAWYRQHCLQVHTDGIWRAISGPATAVPSP